MTAASPASCGVSAASDAAAAHGQLFLQMGLPFWTRITGSRRYSCTTNV